MLVLRRSKKTMLSTFVALILAVPTLVFVINKNMVVGDTYADTEESYVIPDGFNDQVFYNCIVDRFKTEFEDEEIPADGLSNEQLAKITRLTCSGFAKSAENKIMDVTGVEKLTGLTYLDLSDNNIGDINLENNLNLTNLNLGNNGLDSVNVSHSVNLIELDVSGNNLSSVDVSHNLSLKTLDIEKNNFDSIDVSLNTLLENLYVNSNKFDEIDVSGYSALKRLDVSDNNLTSLDLTANYNLKTLWGTSNKLTTINFPENSKLSDVFLYGNEFATIDLDNLTELRWIILSDNKLTNLSVDKNVELEGLILGWGSAETHSKSGGGSLGAGNLLASIDVSKNAKLKYLNVGNNNIADTVDVSHNPELVELVVNENEITSLDVSSNLKLTTLIADTNHLTSLDLTQNPNLRTLTIIRNDISEIDLSKNTKLYTLTIDDILVDLDLKSIYEDKNVYDLKDVELMKDGKRSVMATDYNSSAGGDNSGGYTLGDLAFDIEDTDNYSYDKENGTLTIMSPEAIDGSVPVVGGRVSNGQVQGTMNFKLKLPEMKSIDGEVISDAVVQGGEDLVVPNTGANSLKEDSNGVISGWTLLSVAPMALIVIAVRRRRRKQCEIEAL